MTLRALEIPDEPERLAAWLDELLAGAHLSEFVAELLAIHNLPLAAPERVAIDAWLGAAREPFLQNGAAALTPSQRHELLTRPWLLLDLQELIDMAGGRFWQDAALRSPESAAEINDGRGRLQTFLTTTAAPSDGAKRPLPTPAAPPRTSRRQFNRVVLAMVAVAAALLVAFITFQPGQQNNVAWGWNAKDLLNNDKLTPAEYLNRLADAGDKWFKKRPETKADVARRLSELQQGCQRLIAAEHKPLAAEDRKWLVERCRAWSEKFDTQLAALDKGASPIIVRGEVDKIVNKLVETLKARASERA